MQWLLESADNLYIPSSLLAASKQAGIVCALLLNDSKLSILSTQERVHNAALGGFSVLTSCCWFRTLNGKSGKGCLTNCVCGQSEGSEWCTFDHLVNLLLIMSSKTIVFLTYCEKGRGTLEVCVQK